MAQLIILRHSQAVANAKSILMGAKYDSPLSKYGKELARRKGIELKQQGIVPDKVYCSKLKRSKQTAKIIAQELGVKSKITELAELNERDFGKYDGKHYSFVLRAFEKHNGNPPGIEPVDSFVERVMTSLKAITRDTTGTSLVITHSNPIMVMQAALFQTTKLQTFWELGDPDFCEGFSYEF